LTRPYPPGRHPNPAARRQLPANLIVASHPPGRRRGTSEFSVIHRRVDLPERSDVSRKLLQPQPQPPPALGPVGPAQQLPRPRQRDDADERRRKPTHARPRPPLRRSIAPGTTATASRCAAAQPAANCFRTKRRCQGVHIPSGIGVKARQEARHEKKGSARATLLATHGTFRETADTIVNPITPGGRGAQAPRCGGRKGRHYLQPR